MAANEEGSRVQLFAMQTVLTGVLRSGRQAARAHVLPSPHIVRPPSATGSGASSASAASVSASSRPYALARSAGWDGQQRASSRFGGLGGLRSFAGGLSRGEFVGSTAALAQTQRAASSAGKAAGRRGRGPRAAEARAEEGGVQSAQRARSPVPGPSAEEAAEALKQRSRTATAYGAEQIQVLEGLEPVRKRPGMYIGSTGPKGLHHLVYEVVDNAIDEALAGHCSEVLVELLADGSCRVSDDGRGIPTDVHPATGKSAVETVLTVLHAGGKFGGGGYKVSGGLHGVGVSVVNALSEELDVEVYRNGKVFTQSYRRGAPQADLASSPSRSERKGTTVRFKPDHLIFTETTTFDYSTLCVRLRELAFLNAGVRITLADHRANGGPKARKESARAADEEGEEGEEQAAAREAPTPAPPSPPPAPLSGPYSETYHFAGGIREYITFLNRDKQALHQDVIFCDGERDNIGVQVAMQWAADSYSDNLLGFVNAIRTNDGGTHVDGLKATLTRTLNAFARKSGKLKEGAPNLGGDFVREGLTAIVSVQVPNPEFQGQTKARLGNTEVRPIVDALVGEAFAEFLEFNPEVGSLIVDKALQAWNAAEAARRARELVRRKSVLESGSLPGKLADCSSREPSESEVFIVEGDSAGGSAKQARDRRFQAILPLRGKILNVEKTDDSRIYKNSEIQALITALGLGIKGDEFDSSKLRYHRIIILTDADVDGAHIRTLLLTFFYRYQRALLEEGFVYIACPPLYKVERGKKAVYCYNDDDLRKHLAGLPPNTKYNIQRFKGLGEMMPTQLWETTLDPARRGLKRVTIDDAAEADHMFTILMGNKVGPRKEFIEVYGPGLAADRLDI
eukprot:tig00000792_g4176.t1